MEFCQNRKCVKLARSRSSRTSVGSAGLRKVASSLVSWAVLVSGISVVASATAAAAPLEDEAVVLVGESLRAHLEGIEAVGFGLAVSAAATAASGDAVAFGGNASSVLDAAEEEAASLREERVADGLVVLSSEVELIEHSVVGASDETQVVSYEYLFTRELPGLTGDDAWQEVIEYEVTIDTKSKLVTDILPKDLDYYTSLPSEASADELPASTSGPSTSVDTYASSEFSTSGIESKDLSADSRRKVADYALQWWNSKNSNYPTDYDNDCTNFTSQALHAGGWSFVSGLWNSDKAWWGYNRPIRPKASYPWGGAENLYRFAVVESKRTTIHGYISDLRVGDILQYKSSGSSVINHSMVVTKVSGGQIYLTYHTVNTKNKPFSELNKTPRTWFGHKV